MVQLDCIMLDSKNPFVCSPWFLSVVASLLVLAACGSDTSGDDDALFATWAGSWQAVEPLFRDDSFGEVVRAIQGLRPDYDAEEIEGLFLATADVDYTSFEAESNTLAFLDGDRVVCSGRYEPGDVGFTLGPEGYTDFALTEETGGDCSSYVRVSISDVLPEPGTHFHVVTGTSSGPLNPPPWNPSVWPSTTTSESFTQLFLGEAPDIASALPER